MPLYQLLFDDRSVRAGEKVSGIFHVRLESSITAKYVRIDCEGFAQSQIGQGRSAPNKEKLVSETISPWFTASRSNVLPAGEYRFPFSFTIPVGLPVSIDDNYLKVEYRIKAKIHQGFFRSVTVKEPFLVKHAAITAAQVIPGSERTEQCDNLRSGNVLIGFHANRSVVEPKQLLRFKLSVHNHSKKAIIALTASLLQTTVYTLRTTSRHHRNLTTPFRIFRDFPLKISMAADLSRQDTSLNLSSTPDSEKEYEFAFFIPEGLLGTGESRMMQVEHHIFFDLKTTDSTFAGFKVLHPITIGKLQPDNEDDLPTYSEACSNPPPAYCE